MIEDLLLSKLIDENAVTEIKRYNLESEDFPTRSDLFAFITEHIEQHGRVPAIETVTERFPEFADAYLPNVEETFEYLVKELKNRRAKREIYELFVGTRQKELKEKFEKLDAPDFIDWFKNEIENIDIRTSVRYNIGTSLDQAAEFVPAEYRKRKEGKSFKIWRSPWPSLNEAIKGFFSENMYAVFGQSGRGKSIITSALIEDFLRQGARVLVYSLEMSRYEWLVRLYAIASARDRLFQVDHNGVLTGAGFDVVKLLTGKLSEEEEGLFMTYVQDLPSRYPGKLFLRACDDPDLTDRSVRQIERDIIATEANVVVIDPFYLLDFERNYDRKVGGGAERTSRKLKALFGRMNVCGIVIVQAEEEQKRKKDEDRQAHAPDRGRMKTTKAVLEDATSVISVDSKDGIAILSVQKGRNGGEGVTIELIFEPNRGLVFEPDLTYQF